MSRVLFITEKLGTRVQKGSTALAEAGLKRGHGIFECLPNDISLQNGKVIAKYRRYKSKKTSIKTLTEEFDIIYFRANPPVTMNYLTCLYLLRLIEDKVLIINRPSSIISFPEKIFPHHFAKFSPPTLITSDKTLALGFIRKQKEVVTKPIYMFGGMNIIKLSAKDKNLNTKISKILKSERVILQKFLPEVSSGDKRIFFVNGKVAGCFLRKPKPGSILANLVAGGTAIPSKLTTKETQICKTLGPKLARNGILLCGIDVIGDYVTEINITSPMGFSQISKLYNQDIENKIWEAIESAAKRHRL